MIKMNFKVLRNCKKCYSTNPVLPKFDHHPMKYNGLSLEKMKEIRKANLNPALSTYYSEPLALCEGSKQWLFDVNGKRYLDMFGGICTVSVGHSHPKITEVVMEQIQKLTHCSNVYYHPKIHEYAQRLTEKMPKNLNVVYFVNSGSEANDLAILMSRMFTGNTEIITLQNSYHGMTYQTMGLTSNASYKFSVPQPAGFHRVMNPDVYSGLWGGSHCRDSPVQTSRSCSCAPNRCEASGKYIDQLKKAFKYNIQPGKLAAMFAESIQGVGGTVQFPIGYIREACKVVKENGGLFVADEVQTGFGRTGEHFWGFQMHGIEPDIVTMAKGMGNGFPLAAVVTRPEIAAALTSSLHFNTFGGNPISCSVGMAVLDIIEEEKLQENANTVGTYLLKRLQTLREKFAIVGDVRGKGLMIGVELVKDSNGSSPIDASTFIRIWEECRDLGLILGRGGISGNVFRIKPPMCVTKEDADFTVDVLNTVLKQHV